jgi:hypothetical protein
VAFYDTENGSSYLLPILFKPAKIELMVVKSRSFSDLMSAMEEAQRISDILIIDSVSHVWAELQEAFKRKNNVQRLQFQDWGIIKPEWQRFTTAYLNSPLHIIVAGRSKDDYTYETDERGKKELIKTGTRMQTEKNLSYEPSLLIELEKVIDPKTNFWIPRAWILKDRFGQIDGKCFDKPTFKTFLPHIQNLNLGGVQVGIDTTRTSDNLFHANDGESLATLRHNQAKWTEEIEATLVAAYPGQSSADKKKKLDLLKLAFGGYSWTMICDMRPEALQDGLLKIREAITADLKAAAANGSEKETKKAVA